MKRDDDGFQGRDPSTLLFSGMVALCCFCALFLIGLVDLLMNAGLTVTHPR